MKKAMVFAIGAMAACSMVVHAQQALASGSTDAPTTATFPPPGSTWECAASQMRGKAFDEMASGKPFKGMAFTEHLPFAFQFGEDDDPDGVMVLIGRLETMDEGGGEALPWPQVNGMKGGRITIDNSDSLLEFHDIAGNVGHRDEKSVTLPLDTTPVFLKSAKGPAAIRERLRTAEIKGKRGIEISARDFASRVDADGTVFVVELRNRLNATLAGTLAIAEPKDIRLAYTVALVELAPGEAHEYEFPVASATPNAANSYRFQFSFLDASGATAASATTVSISAATSQQAE